MNRIVISGALAVALLAPTPGSAQMRVIDTDADRTVLAEEASRQGYLLAEQRADFEYAASFLRSAASLRADSEAAVRDLMNAGHFNVYAERSLSAASAFSAAGEMAAQLGDLSTAARAFRFAAHAADRVGDADSAVRFLARSEALGVQSEVVTAAQTSDR